MGLDRAEVLRYIHNGLMATVVHFFILTICLEVLHFHSAGMANFTAAFFGSTASFIGSRYFVFKRTEASIIKQAAAFSGVYFSIAVLHGLVLFVWTDLLSLDYRIGFIFATGMQVSLSYAGNKYLVFKV